MKIEDVKVGDDILIKGNVESVDSNNLVYVRLKDGIQLRLNAETLEHVKPSGTSS